MAELTSSPPALLHHHHLLDRRLVYRQTGNGKGEQVTLETWDPEKHTELMVAPRLVGG